MYDFDVYQGSKDGKRRPPSPLGLGGDLVMHITSTLPVGKNFKIFANNFFSSLGLAKALKEKDLLLVGTYRANSVKGCDLKNEQSLKKPGRRSCFQKVEMGSNIVAARWYDNKTVDLMSSYVGKDPLKEVSRYDQQKKIRIPCPAVVKEYNQFMGGIDLLDALKALY